jgi:hypothetical protein
MAAPNIFTQGRREREEEMVWRGRQYDRAIGLYFRKFGKYPTSVDDLVKQTNGVRFLRKAYKDPMNQEDGSWRFIYVGPNGQLIGSLRHTSVLQNVLTTPPVSGASPFAVGSQSAPSLAAPSGAATGTASGTATGPASGASAPNPLESQPQPLGGAVIGGNIIGVGSKIKQSSLRIYEGGDTYEQWEFIWNPTQVGQVPAGSTPPTQLTPGTTAPPGTPTPGGMPQPGTMPQPPATPPPTFP